MLLLLLRHCGAHTHTTINQRNGISFAFGRLNRKKCAMLQLLPLGSVRTCKCEPARNRHSPLLVQFSSLQFSPVQFGSVLFGARHRWELPPRRLCQVEPSQWRLLDWRLSSLARSQPIPSSPLLLRPAHFVQWSGGGGGRRGSSERQVKGYKLCQQLPLGYANN